MSVIGKNYGKPTLDLNFAGNKSLIDTTTGTNYVTFTRAQSGNEATYVGSDGLIKYASADEPRFDHDPVTGDSLGLLVEELRTNLMTYSEDFSQWTLTNVAVSANATTAPDGLITADKLSSTTGSWSSFIHQTFGGSGTRTLSIFAKAAESSWMALGGIGAADEAAYFNLSSGTVGTIQGNVTEASIEQFPNGWYRCSVVCDFQSYGGVIPVSGDNTLNIAPIGDGIYIWGAQLEESPFPTSYIPTSGSTETRAADEASITGTNFSSWYNQSEGTWFANIPNPAKVASSRVINTGINLWSGPTNAGYVRTGSSSVLLTTSYPAKISAKYNNSSLTGAVNGVLMGEAGGINSVATYLDIGSANTAAIGVGFLNASISRLTYWPKRLPDIELQQLTK